ncbi:patatin-like phospholipase family protein [Pelagibacterium sp.]|uniref:patatin-like phospholipase family protein n=1 Tax=Pelagibacterium sp. TaxID=1967288 RepID=UPI003BA8D8C3
MAEDYFRILSLDGGGAKGFYTLGVLHEIEKMLDAPLHDRFDLIFGTSTGSIIGSLLALGKSVDEVHTLYSDHVVKIMSKTWPWEKSAALKELADEVYDGVDFDALITNVGIVTTKWVIERPMIFKSNVSQAHGRTGSFVPGFGVPLGEAVQASCSAYPFFNRKKVTTKAGDTVELIDGGYCANNPTLYAIADATNALNIAPERLRVVNVGVGEYPAIKKPLDAFWWLSKLPSVKLLQKTMEINTQSMDQLRNILFNHIQTLRISDSFTQPEMATDIFEHDRAKLNILRQRGRESFAKHESVLREYLT